jgi:prepilin signal peptidase PulO-like enzyme (type II secretory pathway)
MVALAAAIGLLCGGLANLIIYRLPRQQHLLRRPRCTRCEHPLGWEAIPLAGYLLQRGRCRHCDRALSPHFILVELLTTACFAVLAWRISIQTPWDAFMVGLYAFFSLALIVTLFIDWLHRDIYYIVLLPTIVIAVLGHWLHPFLDVKQTLLGLAVGIGFFALLFLLGQILFRGEAMGLGDVWLAGMIGAILGLRGAVLALAGGMLLAGLVGGLLLLIRKNDPGDYMPYGAYLCIGALGYLCLWAP